MKEKGTTKETNVTIESQITHLKRENAGLRGRNTKLKQMVDDLDKCVSELLDEKTRNEAIIEKLTTKVADLQSDYAVLRQVVQEYNALPWYKRLLRHVL
jgi:cell division protein FtsB